MKKLFVLLAAFALAIPALNAQTSQDTANGWYLWKVEGTGIDSAYTYICDTTSFEGTKSQAFAYSTTGGAIYSFRKDFTNEIATPDRITANVRLGVIAPMLFSMAPEIRFSVIVSSDTIVSEEMSHVIGFSELTPTSEWYDLEIAGFFDSLRATYPTIQGIVLSFNLWANWPNPSGNCTLLLDHMIGLYQQPDSSYDKILLDRFGDSGPAQYVTPQNCLFKGTGSSVVVDSFRVVNMSPDPLAIGNRIVSTNPLFSIQGSWMSEVLPRDSITIYVQFTPDGTPGEKSGLILITHDKGTDTVYVTANGGTVGIGDDPNAPMAFSLSQNYPNPFNPTTTIRFTLPARLDIQIVVYNLLGQAIMTIAEGSFSSGEHEVAFDGNGLASGTYIYRITAGSYTAVKKMILMK